MSVTLSELPFEILLQIVTECDDLTIVILYCTSVLLRRAVITTGVQLLLKSDICSIAAKGGHLDVLKWCRDNGCQWNEYTCYCAASGGNLDVLKWLIENGCPWDEDTCYGASVVSNLYILEWCRDNVCKCGGKYHKEYD